MEIMLIEKILFEIVDILEYMNNDYDKEMIREKIKKLYDLIIQYLRKEINQEKNRIQSEKEFNKILHKIRGDYN